MFNVNNDKSANNNASKLAELDDVFALLLLLVLCDKTLSGDSMLEGLLDEDRRTCERSERRSIQNSEVMLGSARVEGPAAVRTKARVLR